MGQGKGGQNSEKNCWIKAPSKWVSGTSAADERTGWRCHWVSFWGTTWLVASSPHGFCCSWHCLPISYLCFSIFLTYFDNLFHRCMLTWRGFVLGMRQVGLGLVGRAGAGWSRYGASSPLLLSLQYAWWGAREVCSTLQTRACLKGQWGGQEGILCSLKSGIARRVGTSTETTMSLEMSLGMGHQFLVELPDSRAQRDHLVHSHGPAQHKLC